MLWWILHPKSVSKLFNIYKLSFKMPLKVEEFPSKYCEKIAFSYVLKYWHCPLFTSEVWLKPNHNVCIYPLSKTKKKSFYLKKHKAHYNAYLYLYKGVCALLPIWWRCIIIFLNRINRYWPQHKCDQSFLLFVDGSLLDSSCKFVL